MSQSSPATHSKRGRSLLQGNCNVKYSCLQNIIPIHSRQLFCGIVCFQNLIFNLEETLANQASILQAKIEQLNGKKIHTSQGKTGCAFSFQSRIPVCVLFINI